MTLLIIICAAIAIACGLWSLSIIATYRLGVRDGRERERLATVRAMDTIREHYAVPPDETLDNDTEVCDNCHATAGQRSADLHDGCPRCNPDAFVTAEEFWDAGKTGVSMAEAQEMAEQEEWESNPVGRCEQCGRPVYTTEGFCGRCRVCR